MNKYIRDLLLVIAFELGSSFSPPSRALILPKIAPINTPRGMIKKKDGFKPPNDTKENTMKITSLRCERVNEKNSLVNIENKKPEDIIIEINVSKKKKMKAPLTVTDDQSAIIFGTLLGDGHLQKRDNSYRLKIAHCSKQKSYLDWMYNKLDSLCKTTQGVTKREYRNETVYEFYTQSGSYLKPFHDLFYQQTEKIVNGTKKVFYKKTITPELIAALPKNKYTVSCFYLDDGTARGDCYSGRFATQGFSKNECHLLQSYFADTWKFETSVVLHSREKNQYSLDIPAKEFPKFVEIVEKPIREIPEMVYKLNEKNRNKSRSFNKKE